MVMEYDEATFFPVGLRDGEAVGTLVRKDGATRTVAVSRRQEDEPITGDLAEMRCRGDGTYDVRIPHTNESQRGWTPAYETGWDRIFGGDAPEA